MTEERSKRRKLLPFIFIVKCFKKTLTDKFLVTLFKIKSSEREIFMLKHVIFAKRVQNREILVTILFSSTSFAL